MRGDGDEASVVAKASPCDGSQDELDVLGAAGCARLIHRFADLCAHRVETLSVVDCVRGLDASIEDGDGRPFASGASGDVVAEESVCPPVQGSVPTGLYLHVLDATSERLSARFDAPVLGGVANGDSSPPSPDLTTSAA